MAATSPKSRAHSCSLPRAVTKVVNKVIIEGLVTRGVKLTDLFYIGYSLIQFFKCYLYRYITKHYKIETRCSDYTSLYKTRVATQELFPLSIRGF